ncbi:MAG: prepilin-type N-terminal cleavage/methylation domain-containing protein [Candidatus Woesebacteria bacterium]
MKQLNLFKAMRRKAGFTMIELLIIITILGILAVAVLSAINPIEQINRGRDTSKRSDSEQLISAIQRYYAFNGHYPWLIDDGDVSGAGTTGTGILLTPFDVNLIVTLPGAGGGACGVGDRLSTYTGAVTDCIGTEELKLTFISRIQNFAEPRKLFVYNRGNAGDSTYVCFIPLSGAFRKEANDRCTDTASVPADFPLPNTTDGNTNTDSVCAARDGGTVDMICLP